MGHRRYADATGDVFYLVRTACNVGMRLIENGPSSELAARGETAVRLASLAFDYDPANVFAWSLLRDALVAAGRSADAELVGWEPIRRFPEDPQRRTQLATVLAKSLGRPEQPPRSCMKQSHCFRTTLLRAPSSRQCWLTTSIVKTKRG